MSINQEMHSRSYDFPLLIVIAIVIVVFIIVVYHIQVDVYSFGVLLCEMCIQEMPDPEKREQQVALVTNRVLRALIRGCLQSEPEARPSMEEINDELEQPE